MSVVSSDADNVYITVLTAAGIRARTSTSSSARGEEGAEKKLLRAGASKVVCPYAIGGAGIANAILRPAVVDFIELVTRREHLETADGGGPRRGRVPARRGTVLETWPPDTA